MDISPLWLLLVVVVTLPLQIKFWESVFSRIFAGFLLRRINRGRKQEKPEYPPMAEMPQMPAPPTIELVPCKRCRAYPYGQFTTGGVVAGALIRCPTEGCVERLRPFAADSVELAARLWNDHNQTERFTSDPSWN